MIEVILYIVGLVLVWVVVNAGTKCLLDWLYTKAETKGAKWNVIYYTVIIVLIVLFLGLLITSIYKTVGGV
mgnify:CR=1 FL=1